MDVLADGGIYISGGVIVVLLIVVLLILAFR